MTKRCFLLTCAAVIYHCLAFTCKHVPAVVFLLHGVATGQNIVPLQAFLLLSNIKTYCTRTGLSLSDFVRMIHKCIAFILCWVFSGLPHSPLSKLQHQMTLNPIVAKQNQRNVIILWSVLGSPISLQWLLLLQPNLISCNSLSALRSLPYLELIPLEQN